MSVKRDKCDTYGPRAIEFRDFECVSGETRLSWSAMMKDARCQFLNVDTLIRRIYFQLLITLLDLLTLILKDFYIPVTDKRYKRTELKNAFCAFSIIFLILVDSATVTKACDIKHCTDSLSRGLTSHKATAAKNIATCLLLKNYSECLVREELICRGDLIYLSLRRIAEKSLDADCIDLMAKYELDNRAVSAERHAASAKPHVADRGRFNDVTAVLRSGDDALNRQKFNLRRNGLDFSKQNARCLFPYQRPTNHKKGGARTTTNLKDGGGSESRSGGSASRGGSSSKTTGYRYCVAFGDPHLRTFDGQHDTCRVLNAWPLVDNAYLNVQLFGERLSNGFNASSITKVSIIVKALPGCTDQKQYTAMGDDALPTAFDDGTFHSGEPSTSNGDNFVYRYNDGLDDKLGARLPPALFIEVPLSRTAGSFDDLEDSSTSRVDIHLRYVATRVIVRRTGRFLSVALKMPVEALAHESTLSAWQLCLASCPLQERIDYKRILAQPSDDERRQRAETQRRWPPSMDRDAAVNVCRRARLTDFFFDACVFDLIVSGGDLSFRDAARFALKDIRRHYPPYVRHYQTNRSDLAPYLLMYKNEFDDQVKPIDSDRQTASLTPVAHSERDFRPLSAFGEASAKSLVLTIICLIFAIANL